MQLFLDKVLSVQTQPQKIGLIISERMFLGREGKEESQINCLSWKTFYLITFPLLRLASWFLSSCLKSLTACMRFSGSIRLSLRVGVCLPNLFTGQEWNATLKTSCVKKKGSFALRLIPPLKERRSFMYSTEVYSCENDTVQVI